MQIKQVKKILNEYVNKKILSEVNFAGLSNQEAIDKLTELGQRVWVVFDTETMGFDQLKNQITEIAAIAINVNNWEEEATVLDTYHRKMNLSRRTRNSLNWYEDRQRDKGIPTRRENPTGKLTPQELLKMTSYFDKDADGNEIVGKQDPNVEFGEELEVLEGFFEFIERFDNPLVVAHNATFDMKMVGTRLRRPTPRVDVFDSLPFMRLFLIPTLRELADQGNEEAQKNLDSIKTRFGFSSSLGKIRDLFDITGNWHSAIADVQMTIEVIRHAISFVKENPDMGPNPYHTDVVKKAHRTKGKKRRKELGQKAAEDIGGAAEGILELARELGRELSEEDALMIAKQLRASWKEDKERKKKGYHVSNKEKRRRKQKSKKTFARGL
tara:strand:+ start:280 stop:1428 length:1149 start_codon:yes stop_codon:yes gene_type:complete